MNTLSRLVAAMLFALGFAGSVHAEKSSLWVQRPFLTQRSSSS